jgi:hypothetical protein
MGSATNGITKIFVAEVETRELCIADSSGAKTCLTKAQLDGLIAGAAGSGAGTGGSGSGGGTPPPPPDTTAPVVTPTGGDTGTGNQTINIGDTWTDLGATAVDAVDGIIDPVLIMSEIKDAAGVVVTAIDTTVVGVFTVTYSATDAAGNVGTAVRIVTVQ